MTKPEIVALLRSIRDLALLPYSTLTITRPEEAERVAALMAALDEIIAITNRTVRENDEAI